MAYFVGEEGPVTALFGDAAEESVPSGFDFDYVDLTGLETGLSVEDGELVSRGARYRLLYLGGASDRMSVRALRAIDKLRRGGSDRGGGAAECAAFARRRSARA